MTRNRLTMMIALAACCMGIAACGSSSSTSVPSSPSTLYAHALAFKDSALIAWGYNGFGQLGVSPSQATRNYPQAVAGLTGMSGFSAGADHSLAFMNNSTVRAWGYNAFGQLGTSVPATGGVKYSNMPVKVGSLTGVVAVSAGGHHSLALKNDGTVWAWGHNAAGQVGDGTLNDRIEPAAVLEASTGLPLSAITKIAAGGSHNLALRESTGGQTLFAWGSNTYGQLGPDSTSSSIQQNSKAVPVTGISGKIIGIACGGSYNLALTEDGRVWAWGYNGVGQLGVPAANLESYRSTPEAVKLASGSDLAGVTQIVAGLDHVTVLMSDSTLLAWGFNRYGQLGNNSSADSYIPVQVVQMVSDKPVAFTGVQSIIPIKGNFTVVRKTDGTLWAWGDNTSGQVGDKTTTNRWTPVRVAEP